MDKSGRVIGYCVDCGEKESKSITGRPCKLIKGMCNIWTHDKVKNAIRTNNIIAMRDSGMSWEEIKQKLLKTGEY